VSGGAGVQRMYDVYLRSAERHKLFAPGEAALSIVLPSYDVYFPAQLAN
jgi:hypothetical protein